MTRTLPPLPPRLRAHLPAELLSQVRRSRELQPALLAWLPSGNQHPVLSLTSSSV